MLSRKMPLLGGAALAALCCSLNTAHAAIIFENPITGSISNAQVYNIGHIFDPNLSSVGGLSRVGLTGKAATNTHTSFGSPVSRNNNTYLFLSLTPAPGFWINFTSFSISIQRASNGPSNLALRSDAAVANTFSTDIASNLGLVTNIVTTSAQVVTYDLSGPTYQNIARTTGFRLIPFGPLGDLSLNDFTFRGEVVAIPEPTTALLVPVLAATLFTRRRR